MATAMDPKLAKLKKKKSKTGSCRTVMLGNPDIVQVPLRIEKSTGQVKNLDQLKTIVAGAELSELTDLYESLLGKKTRARKTEMLAKKINNHIDAVAEGYLEAVDDKAELPEALAEAAGKEKSEPTEKPGKPHPDEGESYTRTYKGAEYTLTCMGQKRYRLEGPSGHPACNKLYSSPGAAAKIVTGTSAEINGRSWFGMPKSKRAMPGSGGTPRRNIHRQKMLRPRDARLPLIGAGFIKVYEGITYNCTMLKDNKVRIVAEATPECPRTEATYNSISQAATEIGGSNESGFRFFHLNQGVDQLDFVKVVAGTFLAGGGNIDSFMNVLDTYLELAEESDNVQEIVDQLGREFYKRRAIEKLTASFKKDED